MDFNARWASFSKHVAAGVLSEADRKLARLFYFHGIKDTLAAQLRCVQDQVDATGQQERAE